MDLQEILAALPEKGEKRIDAILALKKDEGNAEALLQLTSTEKGKGKTAAQKALAQLDYPLAAPLWQKLLKGRAMNEAILMPSCTDCVSDEVAPVVSAYFSSLFALSPGTPLTVEQYEKFKTCLSLMLGKGTDRMQEVYRMTAQQAEWLGRLQRMPRGDYDDSTVWIVNDGMLRLWQPEPEELAKIFPAVLTASIVKTKDQRLIDLADELYGQYGGNWLIPVFMSRILTQSAREVYDEFSPYLTDREKSVYLFNVLGMLIYVEREQSYQAWIAWGNYSYGSVDTRCSVSQSIAFDQRWLYALAQNPTENKPKVTLQSYNRSGVKYEDYDEMLLTLLPQKVEDPALKAAMGEYFALRVHLDDGETQLYTDAANRLLK